MLLEKISLNQENMNLNYFRNSNKKEIKINYDKDVYEKANDIYSNFKHRFNYNDFSI